MPSSLTVVSPTPRYALPDHVCPFTVRVSGSWGLAGFLGSMVTGTIAFPRRGRRTVALRLGGRICLPPSAPLRFNPLFRQGAAVSLLRRRFTLPDSNGILTVSSVASAIRLGLGPDLPRADRRRPGTLGLSAGGIPTPLLVTYTYICLSMRSSAARAAHSTRMECSPTDASASHGFGNWFNTRLLSTPGASTSELLRTL